MGLVSSSQHLSLESDERRLSAYPTISLGWILSRFFVEKAFSENAKDFGDQIVSGIKEQFIKKLNAAAWMSKDVRKLGIEKGDFHPSNRVFVVWLIN